MVPILLSRLPNELTDLVPCDSLENMLDFLLSYDMRRPSWHQFTAISTKEMRPSFAYVRAQNDMRTAWPGLDDDAYRKMSWDLLRCNFPESLKFNFTVSQIEIPTPDELYHIDDLWTAIQTQSADKFSKNNCCHGNPKPTPILPPEKLLPPMDVHNLQGAEQSFMERVSLLETKIDSIIKLCSTSSFSPANHNYKAPTGFSTSRLSANEQKPYPIDHKYCFYHWRYGQNAHKCNKPCAWSYEHDKGESGTNSTKQITRPPKN